ncbi:hypothetical protein BC940DRAFT_59722 [Gongronella butleri]|nr:hypothetical protein BC940DRAFT_59722 [Gongronella butleri]
MEAARRYDDDQKLSHDHGKLLREGKDIVDQLLNNVVDSEAAERIKGFVFQLIGTQGAITSLHLDDEEEGLYVAVPQKSISLPRSIHSLRRFEDTLAVLLNIRRELDSLAHCLRDQMELMEERRRSVGATRSRPAPMILVHPLKKRMRPTWYSPTHN